jgi:hypothetical protein
MSETHKIMSCAMGFRLCGISMAAVLLSAQTAPEATSGPVLRLTATTANVGGAPDSIRIDILRWSTDAERDKLMSAWNLKVESSAPSGRGAARAGAAGGRGAGGRGGRGAAAENVPPPTPEGTLAAALQETATVGYLWSSEVTGYALRYAGKLAGPNGVERIILITDRRLGAMNDLWKPKDQGQPATYAFSVIELRVNAKGEGQGKISLMGKVAPDSAANIITLENYDALPVVLSNLKSRASSGHL